MSDARYQVATQAGGTILWDSATGERLRVFDRRVDAQAEADRLNTEAAA